MGIRVALLTLLLAAADVAPSQACGCTPPPLWTRATNAPEVFVGRILGLQPGSVLEIRVERAGKGSVAAGDRVTVKVEGGFPRPTPVVGQQWVLFAHPYAAPPADRGARRMLVTSFCAGNWRVTATAPAPALPERADVVGRVVRAWPGPLQTAIRAGFAGVRVWVDTPDGPIAAATDADGRFRLRDVPMRAPRPLRLDLDAEEHVPALLVGFGRHEAAGEVVVPVVHRALF